MEQRYYNADTLRRELEAFEQRYELSSADFYSAHQRWRAPIEIPDFDRVVWADTYRRWLDFQILRGPGWEPLV